MAEKLFTEADIWATITGASGNRYIGKVEQTNHPADKLWEHIVSGELITLSPCYELTTMTQPVQVGPGQMALHRQTLVFPIDSCCEDTSVTFMCPSEVSLLSEMSEGDQDTYRKMIERVREEMLSTRLKRSNLILAGLGDMPKDKRG